MNNIIIQIKEDFIAAFKNKETTKKNILGVIKTKIVLFEKEKGEISEIDTIKIIKSEVKEIRKTLESVNEGTDLYIQAIEEKEILESYLPEDMSDEEVRLKVESFISDNNLEKKDFGRIMGTMSKELNGLYDNKKLKGIIDSIL